MQWVFAPNNGGRDSGFHDAGVETFKGNIDRYLARELIQNSLDARLNKKKPVHVKFDLLSLQRREIPGMDYLQETFGRCAEYWSKPEKARKFFSAAAGQASKKNLQALLVSDYNTTGVDGADNERDRNWYNLIRCAGSSSKGSGEGGSFGIGKNAPFAASRLRTVLYSTLSGKGQYAFQGVAMLASHLLPDGATAQPTGFLGGPKGQSIRNPNKIPQRFKRTERGLDIVILEFSATDSWQNDLMYSVLDNFWPAIDFGDLVVTVGKQRIDRLTLPGLLTEFSGREEFNAHWFYRAFKSPSHLFEEELANLKDVALHLYTGDVDLPKRVALVRKTGMVIEKRGYLRSILPFCGVFLCRNEEGNSRLRDMEPPRHDSWDPDHPDKGMNKKIEAEFMGFIRDCIKKLAPVDDATVMSIPGLNRFLPDDDDTPEEVFDSGESASKNESSDRSPLPERIEGRPIDPRRQFMKPDKQGFEEDEEGADDDRGGVAGGGNGGGVQSAPSVPIRYRTFAKNLDRGVYNLMVAGEAAQKVNLVLFIVGDDQRTVAELQSAQLADGSPIRVAGPGVLGPLQLQPNQMLRLEVVLSEPLHVAMEVAAYEA